MPSDFPTSSAASSKHGLSQGAIAGLAVGVSLAIVLLITALASFYVRRRRRRREWWGRGDGRFSIGNVLDPPRHRQVQPSSLVDTVHPRPGQGLETPSPKALSYDYRSIAHDDGVMMEIRVGDDGDSDLGHGYGQKKSIASLYDTLSLTNEPRDADVGAGADTDAESKNRQSTQDVTRWSTIFGSPTRSTFRRSQITPGVGGIPAVPDVPILAPIPKRVTQPDSVLTKEKLRDSNRRSSSLSSSASDNGFLDIPRTSPFAVEFGGHGSSERSSERRINRQRSRSFAEGSVGHTASNALTSFLDFASSAASSFRGSSRSRSRKRQSGSNKSGVSKGTGTQRSRRTQHTSSGSGTNSTGVWTLTLSVDRNGSQSSPRPHLAALNSASSHPFALNPDGEQPESPTDSLPMSVSDINFRVDEDDEDALSNRPSRFLPRHPPLPETPRSFAFTSLTPNDSLRQSPGMIENRQPYVAQTVIGRRIAEARAQSQEPRSDSATGSRSNNVGHLAATHETLRS
ncbi:hypothetical protein SCHPADRAFT_886283 [Schizopora paradoxa]|uniref:Uncharacterized protein n=1 Tax=Schizopora paradoxa TaxID=27342 RepID=A0A0H2S351_9AGAM|nr:hypothetical protein SCHPADRAFT_886283 [Schizopora paradoxa]